MAVLSWVICASPLVIVPMTIAELLSTGIAGRRTSQSLTVNNVRVFSLILGRYFLVYLRSFASLADFTVGSVGSGASKSTTGNPSNFGFGDCRGELGV